MLAFYPAQDKHTIPQQIKFINYNICIFILFSFLSFNNNQTLCTVHIYIAFIYIYPM